MDFLLQHRLLTFLIVATVALLLFILEHTFPLRKKSTCLLPRLLLNALIAGLTFIVASLLVRPLSLYTLKWTNDHSFGMLNLVNAPDWIKMISGFLLLDLTFYYWHRLNHEWPLLWRFHNMHHYDPDLDVSTGFRFHYGEVAYSSLFRMLQVWVIGPSLELFLTYEVVFQLATFFHHSNIDLTQKFDWAINLVMVSPRMHGIHHSQVHQEANSNYGVVFSCWDRFHRTFLGKPDQQQLVIGVPAYTTPEDNKFSQFLFLPFKKQRDYWLGRETRK
jgi:sterol desaturase/sphingolipid hydroxylase (fatty acid hydroxylase superfamily)